MKRTVFGITQKGFMMSSQIVTLNFERLLLEMSSMAAADMGAGFVLSFFTSDGMGFSTGTTVGG